MAENQANGRRTRNGARIGGGHSRKDGGAQKPRVEFDERSTVAWRSLDSFLQFFGGTKGEVPDSQPRD